MRKTQFMRRLALPPFLAHRLSIVLSGLALAIASCWGAGDTVVAQRERVYVAISSEAMTTMMRDMQTSGLGDADHDFVVQMVAHHQGAIDMAMALLRTGSNQRLIRLAHEIIVTQREEIAAMQLAVAEQPKRAGKPQPSEQTQSSGGRGNAGDSRVSPGPPRAVKSK